jgi:hypothetical protein
MRRILDLNQPGIVFAKIIGLFIVVIPALLYGISLLLHKVEITSILLRLIKISLAIGTLVLVVLLLLIIVEQIQDHRFDARYQKNRGKKLLLVNGNYECQYCGNRQVKEKDKTCQVCGRELK